MSTARMARTMREALIEEVKQRPVLYDTRREDHRDAELRDRAWLDIAETLHLNSEVLKREWKILRDSLRQAMRKTGGRRGHQPAGKRWYFESKMAFLLPHMTKRTVYSVATGERDGDGGADESSGGGGGGGGGGAVDERAQAADDGLELFFASVCACARALPRHRQAALKRQVLDALLHAERDHHDDASPAHED